MDGPYPDVLRQIVLDYGRSVCDEPARVRGLLRDLLGEHPGTHDRAVNVLLLALEARAVPELPGAQGLPAEVVQGRAADRLQNDLALAPEAARWAVATWGFALGLWPRGGPSPSLAAAPGTHDATAATQHPFPSEPDPRRLASASAAAAVAVGGVGAAVLLLPLLTLLRPGSPEAAVETKRDDSPAQVTALGNPVARPNDPPRPSFTPPPAHIVLVGIDRYSDPRIKPRRHAEADARALYHLFTSRDYLGVDPGHIRLLLGSPDSVRGSQTATRQNVLAALEWAALAQRREAGGFAFFGQGCRWATGPVFSPPTPPARTGPGMPSRRRRRGASPGEAPEPALLRLHRRELQGLRRRRGGSGRAQRQRLAAAPS